jgi:hypothetical protein
LMESAMRHKLTATAVKQVKPSDKA